MKIHTLMLGEMPTNCYIIESDKKNAVVIDAGSEGQRVLSFAKNQGLSIKKILLTHGHFDHVGGVEEISIATGADVLIHKEDVPMLTSENLSLAYFIPTFNFVPVSSFRIIGEGDIIILDELEFLVMHTPGHTKGGVCYICEDVIFSGDTLFKGNVGRTDFAGGSFEQIKNSVDRIADLEGDFKVYPGHGESTTLERERKSNMYVKGNNNDFNFL